MDTEGIDRRDSASRQKDTDKDIKSHSGIKSFRRLL